MLARSGLVVTAQPVADPRGIAYLDAGSFFYGHVAHANHTYRDHPGSNLVILLHAFSSPSSFMSSMEWDLIYKLFD